MRDIRAVSDDDDQRFCSACAFYKACMPEGFDQRAAARIAVGGEAQQLVGG